MTRELLDVERAIAGAVEVRNSGMAKAVCLVSGATVKRYQHVLPGLTIAAAETHGTRDGTLTTS